MIIDCLERHREQCRECTPFHVCAQAAALIERLVELSLPMPDGERPRVKA